jgi:hypothetical protein
MKHAGKLGPESLSLRPLKYQLPVMARSVEQLVGTYRLYYGYFGPHNRGLQDKQQE